MESPPLLPRSTTRPFRLAPVARDVTRDSSLRHFIKHLPAHLPHPESRLKALKASLTHPSRSPLSLPIPNTRRAGVKLHVRCSSSSDDAPAGLSSLLKSFKGVTFDNVRGTLLQLRPLDVVKWSAVVSVAVAGVKRAVNLVLDPFFWVYFSWTWLFWPWFAAVAIGAYGLYGFYRHSSGKATVFEQIGVVSSVVTWLTLVPPARFNGYLDGWPVVFFFAYHYFFFLNVSVRKRMYGDCCPCVHDPKWDIAPPGWQRALFCIGVSIAHWFAAFEGPELHLVPGGWSNLGIWILIFGTIQMHYRATLYLAKYSEKVVEPTHVVQFGPYRWVRHPIYSSTMLLFATYFASLRASMSLLFVVAVCLLYYEQKAQLEEALMIETFKEHYLEYKSKVRYKFIPWVY